MIKIEERADGVHICGYVNATGKPSRPIITPRGKVIEVIEERAFEQALRSNGEVTVSVDHDQSHIYASTRDNTLSVYEDAIGLHADVLVRDKDLIDIAKKGKIRGWSFGMYNVVDDMEQRADDIPIRHIKSLELDHITLVVHKQPGVKANVIFFDKRPASPEMQTKEVWIYDFRTNIHFTLKQHPMTEDDLADFVKCYNPENRYERSETWSEDNPEGRFRKYSIDNILKRDKLSLDIFWIKDKSLADLDNLPPADELADDIIENLQGALDSFKDLKAQLN